MRPGASRFYTSVKITALVALVIISSSYCRKFYATWHVPTQKRVYVDMVADLFHYGHVNFLRQAKEQGDYLIVGINSDEDVESYKRTPIMTTEERARSVEGCKYVDEVIAHCPLRITQEFIEEHAIDLVIHGDDWPQEKLEDYYKVPMELGIFKTISYTPTVSTTNIINRITERFVPQTTTP